MKYTVVFTPEAEEQLAELYRYIARSSSPDIAAKYTAGIVDYCEELQTLPHRGVLREDIRQGLRILGIAVASQKRLKSTAVRSRSLVSFTAVRATKSCSATKMSIPAKTTRYLPQSSLLL